MIVFVWWYFQWLRLKIKRGNNTQLHRADIVWHNLFNGRVNALMHTCEGGCEFNISLVTVFGRTTAQDTGGNTTSKTLNFGWRSRHTFSPSRTQFLISNAVANFLRYQGIQYKVYDNTPWPPWSAGIVGFDFPARRVPRIFDLNYHEETEFGHQEQVLMFMHLRPWLVTFVSKPVWYVAPLQSTWMLLLFIYFPPY